MKNSADPNQTAPSGSALSAYAILLDILVYNVLGHLPYFRMYWRWCLKDLGHLQNYLSHAEFIECISRPWWLSKMRRLTGDQEVAGSTPAEVGNILS